jgi:hypothetical protein
MGALTSKHWFREREVAAVRQRSKWIGICSGALGLTLALAPLTAASAKTHKPKHHGSTVKGSNPNSAMCLDVKNEQSSTSSTGAAIERAMTSGNFATAKQAMLSAYNADLADVNKALAVIKTAPANVQAAFKALLSYETTFRNDIQNATSEQSLLASFETLGKDTSLVTDGTTIANWYTSVCGGTPITPTTVGVP